MLVEDNSDGLIIASPQPVRANVHADAPGRIDCFDSGF